MCDLVSGQVIVTRPRADGAAADVATGALSRVLERYHGTQMASLDELLAQPPDPAWGGSSYSNPSPGYYNLPFKVELLNVDKGAELSFVEDLGIEYFDSVLSNLHAVWELAKDANQRLSASPNWRLHPAAGVGEAVSDPFQVSSSHRSYLKMIGLHTSGSQEAAGITVAVLDNGFDSNFWQSAPAPVPVAGGLDLIPQDVSTLGHGTLVSALVALSAPGADVIPVRMAGQMSTEWDTLHALTRAVQLGAHVVTLSYRQILKSEVPCATCGLVRTAARSEVFAKMLAWASDGGKRAIVAAAGNDASPKVVLPAAYRGSIPIAALDSSGTSLWSESNWDGANQLGVLALPGEGVAEAITTGDFYSGTSFATAYAAALYAVAMGRYKTTDASVVTTILRSSAVATLSNASVPYLKKVV
jgi:hypothetical protein